MAGRDRILLSPLNVAPSIFGGRRAGCGGQATHFLPIQLERCPYIPNWARNCSVAIQSIRKQYQERATHHHHHHHHHRQPTVIFKRHGGLGSEAKTRLHSSLLSPIPSLLSNHYYNAVHYQHRLTSPEEAGLGADIVAALAASGGGRRYATSKPASKKNEQQRRRATERRLI